MSTPPAAAVPPVVHAAPEVVAAGAADALEEAAGGSFPSPAIYIGLALLGVGLLFVVRARRIAAAQLATQGAAQVAQDVVEEA